jgi:hypothetical protein
MLDRTREAELLKHELEQVAPNHEKLRGEQKRQDNIYNKIKLKQLELQDEVYDAKHYEKD